VNAAFAGGGYERPIVIESVTYGGEELRRRALSFGAATHLVRIGDDTFKLDQTYGIKALGALAGITATGVEAYNCAPALLDEMGFGTPWLTADFDMAYDSSGARRGYRLAFVPADGGGFLARRDGDDVVYRVPRLEFMDMDPGRLMARWYLSPLIMDLRGVAVTAGGRELRFTLSDGVAGSGVSGGSGGAAADRSVSLDGAAFDIGAFRKLFRLLVSASNDGEELAAQTPVEHEPIVTIEYDYLSGLKKADIIEFRRGPTRRLAVTLNGRQVRYGMRDAYAARVAEACAAILAGDDFDEHW
jgi:hypothetical protein